jgi:hypothetical protein
VPIYGRILWSIYASIPGRRTRVYIRKKAWEYIGANIPTRMVYTRIYVLTCPEEYLEYIHAYMRRNGTEYISVTMPGRILGVY